MLLYFWSGMVFGISAQSNELPCEASLNPEDGWGPMTESRVLSGDFSNDAAWITDLAGGIQDFGILGADSSVFYKLEVDPGTRSLFLEWRTGTATSVSAALFTLTSPECSGTDYGESVLESGLGTPLQVEELEQSDGVRWDLCALSPAEMEDLYLWMAVPTSGLGTFTVGVTQQVAPVNDDCGDPRPLGELPADEMDIFCLEGDNTFACPEDYDAAAIDNPNGLDAACYRDPLIGDRSGVWFEFSTPADAGRFDLELNHSNGENVNFTLFEPDPDCSSMTVLYCEQDIDADGQIELNNFDLEPDRTYWILIHTDQGEEQEGVFDFCINVKPPISCENLGPPFFDQVLPNCEFNQFEATCLDMPGAHPDGPFRWPGCFNQEMENPTWLNFVADDDVFEVILNIQDCANDDGVQLALYELSCDIPFNPLNRDGNLPDPGDLVSNCLPFVVAPQIGFVNFSAPVEPGKVYGFLVDGFEGDQCDVFIEEVVSGGGQHSLDGATPEQPVLVDGGFEFGEDTICAGATGVTFELPAPVDEACIYIWTQDGMGVPSFEETLSEQFDFPDPGTYEICVSAATFCDQTERSCIEVVVEELDPFFTRDTICEGDDYVWVGPYGNELTPDPPINTDIPGNSFHTATALNSFDCYVPSELRLFVRNENEGDPTVRDTFACYDDASTGNFNFICEPLTAPGTYEQSCISPTTGCDSFFIVNLFVFGGPFTIDPVCLGNGEMGFFFEDPELGGYTPWFEQLGRLNSDDSFQVNQYWTITGTNDTLGRDLNLILSQDTIEELATNGRLRLQFEIDIIFRGESFCSSVETYSFILEEHFPQILSFGGDTLYCRGREELEITVDVQHPTRPTPVGQPDSISSYQWYIPDSITLLPPSTLNSDTLLVSPPDTLKDGTLCLTVVTERCAFRDSLCIELEEIVPVVPDLGPDIQLCGTDYELDPVLATLGSWRVIEEPISGDTLFFSDREDPNAVISTTVSGTYVLEWQEGLENCAKLDTLEVTFLPPPSASNIRDTCIGLNYSVVIDIIGGVGGYSIHPNSDIGGQIDGNQFFSDTILIDPDQNLGDSLFLVLADSSGCVSDSIRILLRCGCEATAGEMGTDTISLCIGEPAIPQDLMNRFLEENDTVMYVLHTGLGNQLGTVLDSSAFEVGSFNYQMNYTAGQVYYISAVVGDWAGGPWVDLGDPCLAVAVGQPVLWREIPVADAGPNNAICRLTYELTAAPSVGQGQWSVIPDTGNVSFSSPNGFSTQVTVGEPGTYIFQWQLTNGSCEDTDEAEVTFLEPLSFSIAYECNATSTEYQATIIVNGGSETYTEPTNLGQFFNDTLITDWVDAGELLEIRIEDNSVCDPLDIDVLTECVCRTDIGSMDTNDVLTACLDDCLDASSYYDPTGEFLDGNDISGFVLHNSSDTILGSEIIGQSSNGIFCYTDFQNDIIPGDTLYIAHIIGDAGGNGEVNLSDECLKVSFGLPIVFIEPPLAEAGGDTLICDLAAMLIAELPPMSSGNWSYLDGPSANVNIFNPNQPNSAVVVDTFGLHRLIWTLSSNGCSSSDTLEIEFLSTPEIEFNAVGFDCSPDRTSYEVTFTIVGGEESTLEVTGTPGTLTGRSFVSDPILSGDPYEFTFFDANPCDSVTVSGSFDCGCRTIIGTLEGEELNLCADESVGAQLNYDPTGENRDSNDELRFVLISSDETRIQASPNLDFSFDAGTMNLGETYFVRAYLGSVVGGIFQYDEDCTQFDGDIAVTWWAYPEAAINSSDDQLNCSVTSINLDGTGSSGLRLSYLWTTTNGQIDSNPNSSAIRISNEGTYVLLVRDSLSGCEDSISIDIGISSDVPTVTIADPDPLSCRDTLIELDGRASSSGAGITYQWTTPNGVISGPADEAITTVNASGDYTLTVINTDSGCEAMGTVSVEANQELPTVVIEDPDTLGCQTPEIELSGNGSSSGPDLTFRWVALSGSISSDPMLRDIEVSEAGIYQLVVTNQQTGCQDSSQVEVIRAENELGDIEVLMDAPACRGESTGSVSIEIEGGAIPIEYRLLTVDSNSTGIFEGLAAGTYDIELIDANGCIERASATVPEGEDVVVELGPTVRVNRGDSATIEAIVTRGQPPLTYIWDLNASPFECLRPDCSIIQFLPTLDMTTISVFVTNGSGCQGADEVLIQLRDKFEIFIPNVFSPNGDGINDFFVPQGGADVEEIEQMQIFDRWGNLLFESRNFQAGEESRGWNGRENGQLFSPGVYVYMIEVRFVGGARESIHGTVTLVR